MTDIAPTAPTKLHIDLVADVVCPWCYIGWRRLKTALEMRPGIQADITWRPFQLDPSLPEEGVDRAAYMAKKFPDAERRNSMGEALAANAADDGIVLKLNEIPVAPNTNAAHRLIRWALSAGVQDQVVEALFKAYFTDLLDIGDPIILADIAAGAGMERQVILELLAEGTDKDTVTAEHETAHRAGVSGVPFYIFDGKLSVSGAESPERLVRVLDTVVGSDPAASGH